jgi:CHAT domain-containing protein
MSSFYKNLKTKTKVEALRQAQLEMIRGKVSRDLLAQRGVGGVGKLGKTPAANTSSHASVPVSHPYFWAAFVLVGDGQ